MATKTAFCVLPLVADTVNVLFETLKPQQMFYPIHGKISQFGQLKEIINAT